jgi:low affinity Fe/Cu permease
LTLAAIGKSTHMGRDPAVEIPRESQRTLFDRFAERVSAFVSRGVFFAVSLIVVVVWMPTIALFDSVDTWQLVINTMTSVLAFLLIALLQNSERRYDDALHKKIDALSAAMAALLESDSEEDREVLRQRAEELRAAVGLEQKV